MQQDSEALSSSQTGDTQTGDTQTGDIQAGNTRPHWPVGFLLQHRYLLALLSLAFLIMTMLGIHRFLFTSDVHNFFFPDHEKMLEYNRLLDNFAPLNSLVYVIDFADEEVFRRDNLRLINSLTEQLRNTPYSSRVRSISNAKYSVGDSGTLYVDELFSDLDALSDADIAQRRKFVDEDEFLRDVLASTTSNVIAIYVDIEWPSLFRLTELNEVMDFASNFKRQFESEHPGMAVYHSGDVALEYAMLEASKRDMTQLFPYIFVLGFFILLFFLRSVTLVITGFAVVVCAILSVIGIAGWLGVIFDQSSTNVVFLVFIIGLADVVHVMMNYIEALQRGQSKYTALEQSLRINLRSLFLTSLTTGIGFLTLNNSESPTFIYMGNLSALGVLVAFIFTLTLLPVLILTLPHKQALQPPNLSALMQSATNVALKYRRAIVVSTLILVSVCAACIPLNRLNDDALKYFEPDTPIRQSVSFYEKHLMNRQQVFFGIDSGEAGGVNDPKFTHNLQRFEQWLKQQPEVTRVFSYASLLKQLNKNMHDEAPAAYRLPDTRPLAAQYLLLYQMSLSPDQALDDVINQDESATRVLVVTRELRNHEMLDLEKRARDWLGREFPNTNIFVSSDDLMLAKLSQDVKHSMISGSAWAILLIALALLWGLKSLKYAGISMLPNAFPAVAVYGLWGLFGDDVTMAVAVTFSISLGIIVDDTVHILSKYQNARRVGIPAEQAIHQTYRSTGPALVVTSLVICTGLFIQSLSDFGITSTIGIICAPIIAFALLFDFYFLPGVLLRYTRD